ncbi:acetylornithine deacetylase [Pelagibacterium halotolerans]|uniref:Acetylornithine deacetylase n=1 Tax=Pelagibacterium halotolerans (strain DSM 22347 / JCM 15775 / CGMCC 1.7692 / B2) TaxID=1082931 RepID=G4RCF5_PELHB|nr:acetylornithine deacetylase [Pelagibacterium halotolerans]AEQ53749.1 acetylornithine deacetylase [Pelagibacterium halotolerans B2]QJR20090.1 acetylornithine deacetylase [Pelagibacterium halotolerans]SEA80173.1 acetylornithine deacetylase [Pelagibacterium halotolerans]
MIANITPILSRLVAFPTLSRQSNLALLDYVEGLFVPAGIRVERFYSEDGSRANLLATIGPGTSDGVLLSGHCDVVPVDGQDWCHDPFALHEADGKAYGRGTADMKGFLAVAIHTMLNASTRELRLPLQLAISYDEEIGCLGVRGMLDVLEHRSDRPAFCIVGEPTGMRIATGHKGKRALRACCHGTAAHSALAPTALNALHMGAALIARLQDRQERLRLSGAQDGAYDIPYSTIHVGVMAGGTALNIVPERCDLEIEIRNIAQDDADSLLGHIIEDAEAVAAPLRGRFPNASIDIEDVSAYPGLDNPPGAPIVALLQTALRTSEPPIKVAFGTEGGLFHERLKIPTIVCGPGHMEQGHKANEFVEIAQLVQCSDFLSTIVGWLEPQTSFR